LEETGEHKPVEEHWRAADSNGQGQITPNSQRRDGNGVIDPNGGPNVEVFLQLGNFNGAFGLRLWWVLSTLEANIIDGIIFLHDGRQAHDTKRADRINWWTRR